MFEGWGEFYVILGAGSGALLGLLFVVTTLAAGMRLGRDTLTLGSALYMTPSVFHFMTVLVFSAIATVPHLSGWTMAAILGPWALAGTVYTTATAILIRARPLPDSGTWADAWTYGLLPAAMYVGLIACAWSAWQGSTNAPYALAIGMVVLTIIGIRNAWDLVTFIAPRSGDGN
jgi:hypothetical protein